ncbi:MAG: hypothetical protein LBH25_07315 [Fibromonadaceae bacterium]|jgi:hypothetical protein|nr:hypothetical protein [Fibromonadaceae bacterium]
MATAGFKNVFIAMAIGLLMVSCDDKDEDKKQNIESSEQVVLEKSGINGDEELFGNDDLGNKQNPLYGKIYMKKNDILELEHWEDFGGGVIEAGKYENGNYRFGIGHFEDENGNRICIFDEFSKQWFENGRVKYKILDTINVGKLNDNEGLAYQGCLQDAIMDSEIIAIVIYEDKEFHDKIIKAWRANTKTGRFEPIKNVTGITCINEGYGV